MPKKKRKQLKNKEFWAVITIIFGLSLLVILSSVEELNLTGHTAVQSIAYAEEGSELFYEVKNINWVKDVTYTLREDVKGTKIFIKEDEDITFNGVTGSKFSVSSNDERKIEKMVFTFKIPEKDLEEINLNKNNVRLHIDDIEKATNIEYIEEGYLYYSAEANEMGNFVIGMKKVEPVIGSAVEVQEEVEEPVVEEDEESVTPEYTPDYPEPLPMVEEPVVAEPLPAEEEGFFTKIANFFKGLFS